MKKSLRKFCGAFFMEKMILNRAGYVLAIAFSALFPFVALAQVANFVFTSEPQTIEVGAVSEQLTVQAQDSAGASANVSSTACLSLTTTSAQGQFSSSAGSWNPVVVLTMNKNTANKNFYYKDTLSGAQTLTVKAALRPESVTSPCASWPIGEWSIQWTAVQNISVGSQTSNSSASTTATTTTTATAPASASAPASSYVAPPEPQLFAYAGADRIEIVGADSIFSGRAYNRKRELVSDHIRFLWNFGDGTTAEGASVLHHFSYPGKYAVVLTIAGNMEAESDRIIVTAEPARISFSAAPDGSIAIENRAGRDLDLSHWLVRSFGRSFKLPQDSIILSGESLRIGAETLGFRSSPETELDYPNGAPSLRAGAASENPDSQRQSAPAALDVSAGPSAAPGAQAADPPDTSRAAAEEANGASSPETESVAIDIENTPASSSQIAAAAGAPAPESGGSYLWWLGALGIALAGGGAVYAARRAGKREWSIIDDGKK